MTVRAAIYSGSALFYEGADKRGYYVRIYLGADLHDEAGPFDDHEDACHCLERALRLGGGL